MRRSLFIASLIIISANSFSQLEKIRFDHLGIEEGLSQSWVTSIIQDKYGFMWFGTKDGLNRYDGYNFKVYSFVENDFHSLSNITINYLFEESNGDIWVCTSNGLDLYK